MCGIAGIVWESGHSVPSEAEIDSMLDTLAHRGPDGRGIRRFEFPDGSGALLGHRRLSIIDLGSGSQPMSNEDGQIWVSFNGEIYNYAELRPELEAAGHQLRTHSDTETIVHLYEQYGEEFVEHLRGMFAIAIWDNRQRKLVLVRDRLGQKPLVYFRGPDSFAFASELKALLRLRKIDRQIRPESIDQYLLYGYVPHPHTIFRSLHKLPPAHMATFKEGQLRIRRYWSPQPIAISGDSPADLKAQLRETIDEAVRIRLRSDVPVGAFLSGGIDSTAIVGAMQKQAEQQVRSYSIGFPEAGFDESEFAELAARHLDTQHLTMTVKPDSLELLEKLVHFFDEPFSDSSAVPTYYVARMTREHVKVALTGDGGDELFCGYGRYPTVDSLSKFDRLPALVRKLLTGPWVDWIPSGPQGSFRQKLRNRMRLLRKPFSRRYSGWVTNLSREQRAGLYNPDFLASVDFAETDQFLEQIVAKTSGANHGMRAMCADLQSYLPCDLLAKVDITSMANSLECRSPFLDHKVVETALAFPFEALCSPGRVKPLLTELFADEIPPALRNRPKQGFTVPLDHWFRGHLREFTRDTLLAADSFTADYFSPILVKRFLEEHEKSYGHHGERIWSLLFLETWGRKVARSDK